MVVFVGSKVFSENISASKARGQEGEISLVQWLRLCTSTTEAGGRSLVRELSCRMPLGWAEKQSASESYTAQDRCVRRPPEPHLPGSEDSRGLIGSSTQSYSQLTTVGDYKV